MIKHKDYVECMQLLGFKRTHRDEYHSGGVTCSYKGNSLVLTHGRTIFATVSIGRAIEFIECAFDVRLHKITAAINTRNMAKDLTRVRSSNVWAVGYNVKQQGDKTGDMMMQFKGPNGGAGDLYIYYDVPLQTYRRLLTAGSVGHTFWVLVRDNFKYSKLTGNKRGVLPNAVNN
ncbi:KTSC domain-containing protein [Ruminococcus sp.]|uniref:KTSC domain-containing protein n=1 Tax=Ruminococcus sp. TaxID=41978 RepID=UPI001B6BD65F|nr:KTSC domain-containing protein [Ruminococcus sp.]MBP5433737.1 KTSC domain-containing protein [Ruminococcus sp.]